MKPGSPASSCTALSNWPLHGTESTLQQLYPTCSSQISVLCTAWKSYWVFGSNISN